MDFLNVDVIILYLFLLLTLIVGLKYAGKIRSIKEYAVGRGDLNSVILFATLSATIIGGYSIVGVTNETYEVGIMLFYSRVAVIIGYIGIFYIMIPKLGARFMGSISVADMMRNLYGDYAAKVAAVFGIVNCTAILCVQFIALGNVLAPFLGISFQMAVLIPSMVLAIYSSLGGIRSVAMTDLIQFCILIVMVPLLAKLGLDANGGMINVFASVPQEKYQFFSHERFWEYIFLFGFWCLPFVHLEPPGIQRFLMLQNPRLKSNAVYFSFLVILLFVTVMTLIIPFTVLSQFPNLSGHEVLTKAMDTYLPTGFYGLMIAALLAAIMSTADSYLNTASILTIQLFNLEHKKKKSVLFIKFITFLISAMALLVAMENINLISILAFAGLTVSVFVSIPLFFGIICKTGVAKRLYYISSATCAILLTALYVMGFSILYLPFIGACISIPILLSKQIVNCDYKSILLFLPNKIHAVLYSVFLKIVRLNMLAKVTEYCYNNIKQYETYYIAFAVFCVLNYIFPLATTNYLHHNSFGLKSIMYIIAVVMCVGLLMRKHWARFSERYFAIYWLLTLLYCLPFMSVFLFLQNYGELGWSANMVLSIMLLAALVDWFLFVSLTIIGSVLAFFVNFIILKEPFYFGDSYLLVIIYSMLFSLLIGGLFIRYRSNQQKEKLGIMRCFGGAIAHELRSPLAVMMMQAEMIEDVVCSSKDDNLDKKEIIEAASHLQKVANKGMKTVEMLLMAIREEVLAGDIDTYNIASVLEEAIVEYLDGKPKRRNNIKFEIGYGDNFEFYGSKTFVKHTIINLLSNAFKHGGSDVEVKIWLKDNKLYFKDDGVGISPKSINKIFDKFYTTVPTGAGIGLPFCANVLQHMGGSIECESEEGKYTLFTLNFPELGEI